MGRHLVHRLVRVQAEHGSPQQIVGPGLDHTHIHIAVFHRARELARLERRAHALRLAGRHLAAKHQAFGAPAHAGVRVRTRTSPSAMAGKASLRISARPGAAVQQAWAEMVGGVEGDAMNEKGYVVSEVGCVP